MKEVALLQRLLMLLPSMAERPLKRGEERRETERAPKAIVTGAVDALTCGRRQDVTIDVTIDVFVG